MRFCVDANKADEEDKQDDVEMEDDDESHPDDMGEAIGEATKTEEEDMLSDGGEDSVGGPDGAYKKK